MSNPDFSQSPQHVALAKAMASANHQHFYGVSTDPDTHWGRLNKLDKSVMLAMAAAAIDHLGSGYVLPPATEANAERLARANWHQRLDEQPFPTKGTGSHAIWVDAAKDNLSALHAAFGDAEKPEPVFLTPQQADELEEAARIAADPTYCRPGCEKPFAHPGRHSDEDARTYGEDKPSRSADYDGGPDFSAEAAERERERLTEAFMLALAGNPAVMAKMLESHEGDEVMIAAAVADMAQHLAQELIG